MPRSQTQEAIFAEISRQVGELKESRMGEQAEASMLRDLAMAYRFAAGGPQPGSSVVEK